MSEQELLAKMAAAEAGDRQEYWRLYQLWLKRHGTRETPEPDVGRRRRLVVKL
jgi:hypothetical protein